MKRTALREVYDTDTVCKLRRDNYSVGDWSIMTDGHSVWLSEQKMGEMPTQAIQIPKRVFDRMLFYYDRPQQHVRR